MNKTIQVKQPLALHTLFELIYVCENYVKQLNDNTLTTAFEELYFIVSAMIDIDDKGIEYKAQYAITEYELPITQKETETNE